MNKKNKNKDKNKSDIKKTTPSEDIPLWLQGLEDEEVHEEVSSNLEDEANDLELKNLSPRDDDQENIVEDFETSPLFNEEIEDSSTIEDDSHEIMGWVNELDLNDSENDQFQPINDEVSKDLEPHQKNSEIDEAQLAGSEKELINDLSDENIEEVPTEQGFIEISEIDLEESKNEAFTIKEEDLNEDKDLPDWLQEMITEPGDGIKEDTEPVVIEQSSGDLSITPEVELLDKTDDDLTDEEEPEIQKEDIKDTEELEWIPEPYIEEDITLTQDQEQELLSEDIEEPILQQEQVEDEFLADVSEPVSTPDFVEIEEEQQHPDEVIQEIFTESTSQPTDEISKESLRISSEEDTVPVPVRGISPAPIEPSPTSEEIFIPNILTQAHQLLLEGNVELAFDTFNVFIEESAYLELIKGWIQEKLNADARNANILNEALGDIEDRQDIPENGFETDTNTMETLSEGQEDDDETD